MRPWIFLPASPGPSPRLAGGRAPPCGPPLSVVLTDRLSEPAPGRPSADPEDRGRRLGLATSGLPRHGQQRVVEAEQGAVVPPAAEVAEHRAPGREALAQEPPLTAGAQQVEGSVQHGAQVGRARPAEPARRRQPLPDQRELGIGQVGCVALGGPGILGPAGIGPHGGVSSLHTRDRHHNRLIPPNSLSDGLSGNGQSSAPLTSNDSTDRTNDGEDHTSDPLRIITGAV